MLPTPITKQLLRLQETWPRQSIFAALEYFPDPEVALRDGSVLHHLSEAYPARPAKDQWPAELAPAVGLFDPQYPSLLKHIPDPPLVLYCQGKLDLLNQPTVAIVGARRATRSGRELAERFASELGQAGVVVVSGLAYGIDAAAHEGVLAAGGVGIAVLGGGFKRLYPSRHAGLANRLTAAGGLLLSEYPPSKPPLAHQFPERNRVISGLATGTVVVEAGLRSGSLITARLALEQGRDVFAVPGSVSSSVSAGCHRLIRQGAELVTSADEILASIGIEPALPAARAHGSADGMGLEKLAPEQRYLLSFLQADHTTVDELVSLTAWTVAKVGQALGELELLGIVQADVDGYIAATKFRQA